MYEYNGEKQRNKEAVSMEYKQEPPNAIQIELAEGCNLACSFCGIQAIRENGADGPKKVRGKGSGPYKFLSMEVAERIADSIVEAKWNSRLEFAMHGEPTMHPNYHDMIKLFRTKLPKASIMMTSNGGGLLLGEGLNANINKLMEVGLNVLFLDNYDGIKIVDKIQAKYEGPYEVIQYPHDKRGNPHKRRKPKEHHIVVGTDLTLATDGTHAQVSNHAGSAFPLNDKQEGKRCAKPFRELSLRWDGKVALCCNDWTGWYKCGDIMEEKINEIWTNDLFLGARTRLYHGSRDFGPCRGCDNATIRNGLLPDRMGKVEMPKPTIQTDKHVEEALKGGTYTKQVKPIFDFI